MDRVHGGVGEETYAGEYENTGNHHGKATAVAGVFRMG
jgi:hypothetical protein